MNVRILSSAGKDLIEGYHFYEKQAVGIGDYFLESLFSDIDSLKLNAGIYPISFTRYHRMLSKRFPFAIYYRLEGSAAIVYAVLECRRDPAWLRIQLPETLE